MRQFLSDFELTDHWALSWERETLIKKNGLRMGFKKVFADDGTVHINVTNADLKVEL